MHIHWLKNHRHNFIDRVSGKTVFTAECRCGKKFMVDTLFPIVDFKVELATVDKEVYHDKS